MREGRHVGLSCPFDQQGEMLVRVRDDLRLMALFLFVVLFSAVEASASVRDDYKRNGVTITGSATWKPYSYIDDSGEPVGFLVDYWRKWSEKTGVPVRFRLIKWNESIELVASGEADIQSGLYHTTERAKRFGYSKPFFYSKAVVIVRSDISCAASKASLKWGGVTGSEEKRHADVFSDSGAAGFANSAEMFQALAGGKIQAVVNDWSSALMLSRDFGLSHSLKICEDVYTRDLHSIVRKDDLVLLSLLDEGILQISDAEHRVIVSRWFVDHGAEEVQWELLIATLACLVVIMAFYVAARRRRNGGRL